MSKNYQRWLQDLLNDLGRDDIGVGDVEIGPLLVAFSLHKGGSTFNTSLPIAAFFDRAHVMGRLCGLVVRFNKNFAVQQPLVRRLLEVG